MEKNEFNGESLDSGNGVSVLKRRDFLKLAGGGTGALFIIFKVGTACNLISGESGPKRSLPEDYNAFLQVASDGKVTCYTGKIEMGQGVVTSLAQMMAEELDVAFENVHMIMGDTDLCPYDAGTWGSLSTREFGPAMLAAAAEARSVLLSMGADHLKTPADKLVIKNGVIYNQENEAANISFGQLTHGKHIEKYLDEKPPAKDYSAYKLMGKPLNHADGVIKVKGEALYAGDLKMPGMVYAKILRPPSHGASLISADTSEAKKLEGITVIEDKDLVAVLHADIEKAEAALKTVKAKYSFNEKKVDDKTIFSYLLSADTRAKITNEQGDPEEGKKESAFVIDSEFHNSYVAHSAIETHSALAYTEGDRLIARVSTQSPFGVQEILASELGYPLEKVRVIPPFLGGGFGGKAPARQAVEASRLAKLSGKPVMVHWSREEEFFYDTFRPAAVVRITSGVDSQGKINTWDYHEYFAGSRGSDTVYAVPNQRTTSYSGRDVHPFGTGAWRAPGNNTNTFARESQIDIIASRLGADPLEFRLKNLTDKRMIGVLKAVAGLFGYTPSKSAGGRGVGIACGFDAGSYVAHMAEVKVDKETGHVQVVRVACAQDMGFCVNPEGAKIQMEGCITMGMGYALTEEVEFTGGDVKTANYGTYRIPLFSWLPKIDTLILDKKEPMQGGGEPAIICMGAVIANAIFDATGVRLYQLPMTPERVLMGLRGKG